VWAVTLLALLAAATIVEHPATQGSTYTVYTTEGRRTLAARTSGNLDVVSLDDLSRLFGLTVAEDALVGGLTIRGRGQTVLLIPNQSFASLGPGRVVSLPGPVQRERNAWQVPVDFVRLVIGPALGLRVDVRRSSRVILIGDVRLPVVTARFERAGANGRLTFQVNPATPHRVTREGRRLTIAFDAVALEFTPVTGLAPDLAAAVRADGTTILVDLGPSVAGYRADDTDATHLVVELQGPAPAAPPVSSPSPGTPPPPAPSLPVGPPASRPTLPMPPPPPVIDTGSGTLRTIVLDPGHGGDDQGATGRSGAKEKDIVLALARRLKGIIESRIGLRVLLTRDSDENVTIDRRTALANNNKADLFISLHANASARAATRGAQVLSLRLADYQRRPDAVPTQEVAMPIAGGGTRAIDLVPWEFAQIPFAARSATVASVLSRRLAERKVPLYARPTAQLPLRPLVGANMPAVLLEVGFLTNAEDERALGGAERSTAVVDAIVDTIAELRGGVPAVDGSTP
jgi:N-acetylmuramoyl-L-alanine amidase